MYILVMPCISADIILNQQPKELYSLGDVIKIPLKIATNTEINDFLSVKLICNGAESEVHKQYISLPAGDEQKITIAIPLIKSFTKEISGTCVIKPVLGEDFVLTNEFRISNAINIDVELEKESFAPEEEIIIKGRAVKENKENVKGFVDLSVINEKLSEIFKLTDTVNDGIIDLNFSLPEDTKAGLYLLRINVYEKGPDDNISNQGISEFNIEITQVPTSLEIYFENKTATPGEDYKIRVILHDQTGEKISSNAVLKIRNSDGKLIDQSELKTDEVYIIPISYKEPAAEWSVYAESEGLEAEAKFNIIEKEAIKTELINRTLVLTNIGNVPYNKTLAIKIGNSTNEIPVYIKVGDSQKYTLSAPDGEYNVEIIPYHQDKLSTKVMLTGDAITIEKSSGISFFSSFIWLFMILVLGFVAYTIHKKGYKKTFLGRIIPRKKTKKTTTDEDIVSVSSIISTKNPAELSLSIKGHKQNASVICLRIKNESEVIKNKEAVKDIFKKIVYLAEEAKTSIYQSKENIFFIFAPVKTKTFDNQIPAVKLAEKIKKILDAYNRIAKHKINYGIGINYGTIVATLEKNFLKFMSMGTLITLSRRLANHSKTEILLSEDIFNKVRAKINSEKHSLGNLKYYILTEVKKINNKKFISNFIKRLEKENSKNKK